MIFWSQPITFNADVPAWKKTIYQSKLDEINALLETTYGRHPVSASQDLSVVFIVYKNFAISNQVRNHLARLQRFILIYSQPRVTRCTLTLG